MPGSAFEARLATALDAEAGRLLGDGVLDGIGFERLERACRRVALEAMGRALAARLNADRSDERGPRLACPRRDRSDHRGDGLARYAGRRAKTFVTALGEMELSRAWYHCDGCGRGFAPRDRELGFGKGGLSPAVLRMVGCAAGEVSFAAAGSLLHELAGLNVDAKTVERRADGAVEGVCEASPRRDGAPTAWAFSRFLSSVAELEERSGAVSGMVDALRGRLMAELPGCGRHLGYDGKAVPSKSTGRTSAETGKTSDPDADWGRHETTGVDGRSGKAWTRVKSWFGYGLHLIADVEHELPVWFEVERASRSEAKVLSSGIDELFDAEPELASACEDFCADRGLDAGPLRGKLWDARGVRPLIDVREMWREEKAEPGYDPAKPILRPLSARGDGNVLHSEKGEVFCRCPATGEERPMAYQGFEADRGALKYRCPAAACGLECAGREACLRDAGSRAGGYGRVVRVDLATADRRMFTPTPWGSPSWRRGYARRGALERINARLDNSFGFERHFVRGRAKMKARLGLALAVMMALALGSVAAGRPERMRSLVDPGLPLAAWRRRSRLRGESTAGRGSPSPRPSQMRTVLIWRAEIRPGGSPGVRWPRRSGTPRPRSAVARGRPNTNARRKTPQRKSLIDYSQLTTEVSQRIQIHSLRVKALQADTYEIGFGCLPS